MKHINMHSAIPLYIQLMDILIEEMESELGEHEQLSPERSRRVLKVTVLYDLFTKRFHTSLSKAKKMMLAAH